MDIISVAMLAFFGSAFAGGLVGWLVGRVSAFALGLGIGLLVPGIVGLGFATRCLLEYRQFSAPLPNKVTGAVIAVEDRPVNKSGRVTQPVAVVRFTAADREDYTVQGPRASGLKVGDRVTVIYDLADPRRARVGQASELRGGAIVFMLFGTFPFSVGLWFIHAYVSERRATRVRASDRENPARGPDGPSRRPTSHPLTVGFNLLLVAGILWTGLGPGTIERTMTVGFGVVAVALWGHGIKGLFDPRVNASWCFGVLVLAVNFSAWVLALWVLL